MMNVLVCFFVTVLVVLAGSAVVVAAGTGTSGWTADPRLVEQLGARRPGVIYDETNVPAYTLPDPLLRADGTRVETNEQWPVRRAEILELFRTHMFGRAPGKPDELRFEPLPATAITSARAPAVTRVLIHSRQGERRHRFELTLHVPESPTPVPVFLFIDNRSPVPATTRSTATKTATVATTTSAPATQSAGYFPVDAMLARGYAMATFKNAELAPDDPKTFRDGVIRLFEGDSTTTTRPADAWGALAAWAWGASRAMDYLETDARVDAKQVAIVGHSRGGKAALWAGATDERFALVIPNESGCGGAAIERRRFGETIAIITEKFPHWFAQDFRGYAAREDQMPFDAHLLLSLVAPRALYVASATEDLWADPRGEFLGLAHASPVYTLVNAPPIAPAEMPAADQPLVRGPRGYHIRSGKHDLTAYDWLRFADFADTIWSRPSPAPR